MFQAAAPHPHQRTGRTQVMKRSGHANERKTWGVGRHEGKRDWIKTHSVCV